MVTARSTRVSWSARRRPSSMPCCAGHLRHLLEILSAECCGQKKRCMSSTRQQKRPNRCLHNWPARGHISACLWLSRTKSLVPSPSTAGGSAIHRQADRTGHKFRRASRHRHRKRATAQRTSQIPPAADRNLGGAEGHQLVARRA